MTRNLSALTNSSSAGYRRLPRLQEPQLQDSNRSRNDADSINRGIEDSLYWVVRTASAAVAEEAHLFGSRLA
jgi:hypothetical protein